MTYEPKSYYSIDNLRSWLLFDTLVKGKKRGTSDLDNLETTSGNITLGLTTFTETGDENLIVIIDVV